MRRAGWPALVLAALVAGACGKEAPKAAADPAREQKEAFERSKEGAYGTQMKALETAKGLEADVDKKAREAIEKAEQGAR